MINFHLGDGGVGNFEFSFLQGVGNCTWIQIFVFFNICVYIIVRLGLLRVGIEQLQNFWDFFESIRFLILYFFCNFLL